MTENVEPNEARTAQFNDEPDEFSAVESPVVPPSRPIVDVPIPDGVTLPDGPPPGVPDTTAAVSAVSASPVESVSDFAEVGQERPRYGALAKDYPQVSLPPVAPVERKVPQPDPRAHRTAPALSAAVSPDGTTTAIPDTGSTSYYDQDGVLRIQGKSRKARKVDLVGKTYSVRPVKTLLAIRISRLADQLDIENESQLLDGIEKLMDLFLGKEQSADVIARLQDFDDDLDFPDVIEVVKRISELSTANPTS